MRVRVVRFRVRFRFRFRVRKSRTFRFAGLEREQLRVEAVVLEGLGPVDPSRGHLHGEMVRVVHFAVTSVPLRHVRYFKHGAPAKDTTIPGQHL